MKPVVINAIVFDNGDGPLVGILKNGQLDVTLTLEAALELAISLHIAVNSVDPELVTDMRERAKKEWLDSQN